MGDVVRTGDDYSGKIIVFLPLRVFRDDRHYITRSNFIMDKNELWEKCENVFDVFDRELEQIENEIEQTKLQLKKLKRRKKRYEEYIKIYKEVQGGVFGA